MHRVILVLMYWSLCEAVTKLEFQSWTPIPDGLDRLLPFLGTADRIAFDDRDSFLYVIGGASEQLHILDVRDHVNPTIVYSRTFSEITDGVPKAIAFCRSGQIEEVAIAFAAKEPLLEGHVEVFTAWVRFDHTFNLIGRVSTESDPSAIKFDHTCRKFLVTCEGLPGIRNNDFEDPVPHIDLFEVVVDGWNKIQVPMADTSLDQVRYVYKDPGNPLHTVLNDMEPSDLVIIEHNEHVYVTFHENNAIGEFNLNNIQAGMTYHSLGTKDWNNFDIDTSDRDNAESPGNDNINMVRRNIRSFHQPKRLDIVTFHGQDLVITANSGGMKTYTVAEEGVNFADNIRARLMNDALLDPSMDKTDLNDDAQIGRLFISQNEDPTDGWNGIFGYFEHVHTFGARSWSMWDATAVTELWDSGSDLEYQMSQYSGGVFNGDCFGSNNSPPQHLDTRSDDMGVEPLSITHGLFNNDPIVIVGSGRNGGLWVYKVEEGEVPELPSATFQSYLRLGDINGNWRQLYDAGQAGVQYISDLLMVTDEHNHEIVFATCSQMGAVAIFQVVEGTFP